ncbi:MAG TPA: Gfo/Idh/MocA family oxidoreductase [Fimbriimonadaceae bacterium]|nr:Gfo/Idh/MocA family oxidoreductase [Fimbriimonadaceae bacterium]
MVRVAIVGCGFMGRMHANVYGLLDRATLVSVADRKPEKAAKFAAEFGVPARTDVADVLASDAIDAVDICLPTHLHADASIHAMEAGKHVFCEKPMALTVDEADRMIDAAAANGVGLMIGHCIRFWPEYALLKQFVDDGSLGKLVSLNLTRYGEFPSWSTDNWLADPALSGGGVLDMHIHDTDFALYLLGKPEEIVSHGTVDARGPSHAFTTLQFPGCVVHLEGGWNLPTKTPFKMAFRAIFERGAAIMDGGPLVVYRDGAEPETPTFAKMEAQGGGNISDLGGYYHELRYFTDCLTEGQPFVTTTPESSRLSLATTLEEIRQIQSRG